MRKKINTSYLILISFALVLGVSALMSELFRAPTLDSHQGLVPKSLFFQENLHTVKEVWLKNRLGEFQFKKEAGRWNLTEPRQLPAEEKSLALLFKSLKNIKIKKVYQKDALTLSSFALDSPLMEVKIIHEDGDHDEIKFGMMDSISNSTYLTVTDKNSIFQIDLLNYSLENLDMADFINPRIFSQSPMKITSVKIFQGRNLKLTLNQNDGKWEGRNGRALALPKVEEYIQNLTNLKSDVILDEMAEKLKEKVDTYLSKPLYTIEITDAGENKYTYFISTVINSLPDLKIEKRQSFIITASNRKHPYLLSKKYLKLFRKRDRSF
jgi:hypothetical protein